MNPQTIFIILTVIITAGVTILLRAFPFLLFSSGKKCPTVITYIGKILSPAAIAMLVVYCLCSTYQNKSFAAGGWGIPEAAGCIIVVALQYWKSNPLLSIFAGTAVYMTITQYFF